MKKLVLMATLALVISCGGGGGNGGGTQPPPPKTIADTLTYTDPTTGTFRLVKSPTSTKTHLVLEVVGQGSGRGLGFFLSADPNKVTWTKVESTDTQLAHNVSLSLSNQPTLLVGRATGGVLEVGDFQKSGVALFNNNPIVRVAIDLKPNQPLGSIDLSFVKGVIVKDDLSIDKTFTITVGSLKGE